MKYKFYYEITSLLSLNDGEPSPPAILNPSPFWSRINVVWTRTGTIGSLFVFTEAMGSGIFLVYSYSIIY